MDYLLAITHKVSNIIYTHTNANNINKATTHMCTVLDGIPLPGGLMGCGPHPPPPTTLPHLHHEVTTHCKDNTLLVCSLVHFINYCPSAFYLCYKVSTSPRIPSPSGAYQYDPEAGGQGNFIPNENHVHMCMQEKLYYCVAVLCSVFFTSQMVCTYWQSIDSCQN